MSGSLANQQNFSQSKFLQAQPVPFHETKPLVRSKFQQDEEEEEEEIGRMEKGPIKRGLHFVVQTNPPGKNQYENGPPIQTVLPLQRPIERLEHTTFKQPQQTGCIQQANNHAQSLNNGASGANEFIPNEPTPANVTPVWWKTSLAPASNAPPKFSAKTTYLPSPNVTLNKMPEIQQFSSTPTTTSQPPNAPVRELGAIVPKQEQENSLQQPSATTQQTSSSYAQYAPARTTAPVNFSQQHNFQGAPATKFGSNPQSYAGQQNWRPQVPQTVYHQQQSQPPVNYQQQQQQIQFSQQQPIQQPVPTAQGYPINNISSGAVPTPSLVRRPSLTRQLSAGGAVKTKADHWVQDNSTSAQKQTKGVPWPVKSSRIKTLATARQDGVEMDSETMKPIHVITSPQEETAPTDFGQQQEEVKAILQPPVYGQQGLHATAKLPQPGANTALSNGTAKTIASVPATPHFNRPDQLSVHRSAMQQPTGQQPMPDPRHSQLPVTNQQPQRQGPPLPQPQQQVQWQHHQTPQQIPSNVVQKVQPFQQQQQHPSQFPQQQQQQQQPNSWTLLKSIKQPVSEPIQPPSPSAPWAKKEWKPVQSPGSERPPPVASKVTQPQPPVKVPIANSSITNPDIEKFSTPPTSPTKQTVPYPVHQQSQPGAQFPRKAAPGPGGPVFMNWAPKPPTPPTTPGSTPQQPPAGRPQQPQQVGFGQQQQQPRQLATMQQPFVPQQNLQNGGTVPSAPQQGKAPPAVLPKPKLAAPAAQPAVAPGQHQQPQVSAMTAVQPPWKRGKLSETGWAPGRPAPNAAINNAPESRNWTLEKPQQGEIKSTLEHVIGRKPGSGKLGPTKPQQDNISVENADDPTTRCASAPPPNENSEERMVEHLLKPSVIKAQQPKLSPEQIKAMDMTIPKAIKSISTAELLSQYAAAWNDAETPIDTEVVRCGLPEHKRPTEADNDTDVEKSVKRLQENDPNLVEINLNNMKRTPIPQIQRLLAALKTNTHLKKLSFANLGLFDNAMEVLFEVIEQNTTLEVLNIETNFLTGNFLVHLFQSALVQQTLREVKAVNQSATFSNAQEQEMMKAIYKNRSLVKVSLNLRLQETRSRVEKALIRNGELRRLQRKLESEGWNFQDYIRTLSNQEDEASRE